MITTTMGQRAIMMPSRAADPVSSAGSFQTSMASIAASRAEPTAAFQVGHFSTSRARMSQRMGQSPSTNSSPVFMFSLSCICRQTPALSEYQISKAPAHCYTGALDFFLKGFVWGGLLRYHCGTK